MNRINERIGRWISKHDRLFWLIAVSTGIFSIINSALALIALYYQQHIVDWQVLCYCFFILVSSFMVGWLCAQRHAKSLIWIQDQMIKVQDHLIEQIFEEVKKHKRADD